MTFPTTFPLGRPTIVCLCGSTKFMGTFTQANMQETMAGRIVLSVGMSMKDPNDLWADPDVAKRIKTDMDWLHKRKIDLADEILVLNVNGYVGESTRSEIEYAQATGKPVRWWEPVT